MKKIFCSLTILLVFCFAGIESFADDFSDGVSAQYLKNHSFKKKIVYKPPMIIDDTAPSSIGSKKVIYKPVVYSDYKIEISEEDKLFVKPVYNGQIDLRDGVPVKITPLNTVKTAAIAKKIGDNIVYCEVPELRSKIPFVIAEPLEIDGKPVLAKGVVVMGTVGNVVVQEGGGVPGELVVEKFVTYNTKGEKVLLDGKIEVVGRNAAFFAAFFNAVIMTGSSEAMPGFAAVLKKGKIYTVFYK